MLQMRWEEENCLKHLWPFQQNCFPFAFSRLNCKHYMDERCFFLHVHKAASEICLNTVDLALNSLTSGCRGAPAHAAPTSLLLLPLLMHQCTRWLEMRWCKVVYLGFAAEMGCWAPEGIIQDCYGPEQP